jgi:alpha-1,2-rhamnosyltransferase
MQSPRITLDASHTASSGKNTGIERVVRNLSAHLPEVAIELGLPTPATATHIRGHFYPIDAPQRKSYNRLARWESHATEFVPGWIQAIPVGVSRLLPFPKLRKWISPAPSHLGAYKIPHHACQILAEQSRVFRGDAVDPSPQEILIMPDAYWTKRDIWDTVAKHRNAGTYVATIVYDLIPLTHPQFVGKKRTVKFRGYLEQVIRHSDVIIAISKTVAEDVKRYIQENMASEPGICTRVESFCLGAEIKQPTGEVRQKVGDLFSAGDSSAPYLMVASFDPRKNHEQALDAFEMLWRKDSNVKLCFAGRAGASCRELLERIHNHPKLNSNLFVFHDMNDAELQVAYQNCSGVLLPSMVEGFGLPIVESLWHGKKTFASDTPIHREVGGDRCEYFALHSPEALARAIHAWEDLRCRTEAACYRGADMSRNGTIQPFTWEQSTSQLVEVVLQHYYSQHSAAVAQRAA